MKPIRLIVLVAFAVSVAWPALAVQPLDQFVAAARRQNPDALEARANLDQAQARTGAALGRELPGLFTRGSYTRNQCQRRLVLPGAAESTVLVPRNLWDGVAVLSVPIFDLATATWNFDLASLANIRGADAAADAARAREERARLAARDEIHRQWNTVFANIERSRAARLGRDASVHAAQAAADSYQAGTLAQLDLLQATRDAFAAEVARIQANADLLNARAQLRLATGRSLLAQEGVGR
jgi:outer membrane protein TolC